MGRSLGFGSTPGNWTPYSDSLSLRLHLNGLTLLPRRNSRTHYAKGTQSPVASEDAIGLPLFVGRRFQDLFHSPPGVLFTFPSRYWFTIGRQVVFSLGGWSPQIPTGFHVSGGTRDTSRALRGFAYGAITLYGRPFQTVRLPSRSPTLRSHNPGGIASRRFGLIPFRSPLLRESRLISLPPGTEMCQFPGFASTRLCIQHGMTGHDPSRVSPFGNPRIKACLAAPRGISQLATSFIAS